MARLLKRVFDIDIEHCPNCGGRLKIIAAIEDPPVILRILAHLGLTYSSPATHTGAASRVAGLRPPVPDGLSRQPQPVAQPSRRWRSAWVRANA